MNCKITIDKKTVNATIRKLAPKEGDLLIVSTEGLTDSELSRLQDQFIAEIESLRIKKVTGIFTNYEIKLHSFNVADVKNVFVVGKADKNTIQELRNEVRWQVTTMNNSVTPGKRKSNLKQNPTRFELALCK